MAPAGILGRSVWKFPAFWPDLSLHNKDVGLNCFSAQELFWLAPPLASHIRYDYNRSFSDNIVNSALRCSDQSPAMLHAFLACFFLTVLPPDPATGFAQARVVSADDQILYTTQVFPEAKGDTSAQTRDALQRLSRITGGLDSLIRLHGIISPEAEEKAVLEELQKAFPDMSRRPSLTLVRSRTEQPGVLVGFDAVAESKNARSVAEWVALLPAGGRIDIAGQAEKADGTLEGCTRATLENLEKTLKFLGSDQSRIVQLKAFYKPAGDAAKLRRAVKQFFQGESPPLVLVEWDMAFPVEIEMVASTGPDAPVGLRYITPPGMTASPVFSRSAVVAGRFETVYTSGLVSPEGTVFSEQAAPIFAQLKSILTETGSDMNHLAKATYYVSNSEANKSLDKIRPTLYAPKRPPAASKAGVSGVLPGQGRGLVIDMIAVRFLK